MRNESQGDEVAVAIVGDKEDPEMPLLQEAGEQNHSWQFVIFPLKGLGISMLATCGGMEGFALGRNMEPMIGHTIGRLASVLSCAGNASLNNVAIRNIRCLPKEERVYMFFNFMTAIFAAFPEALFTYYGIRRSRFFDYSTNAGVFFSSTNFLCDIVCNSRGIQETSEIMRGTETRKFNQPREKRVIVLFTTLTGILISMGVSYDDAKQLSPILKGILFTSAVPFGLLVSAELYKSLNPAIPDQETQSELGNITKRCITPRIPFAILISLVTAVTLAYPATNILPSILCDNGTIAERPLPGFENSCFTSRTTATLLLPVLSMAALPVFFESTVAAISSLASKAQRAYHYIRERIK